MQARSGTNLISEWRWWRKGIRWVTLTCSLEINQLASAPWKFGHHQYWGRVIADTDLSLEHGGRRGAPLVLQPEGHRRGHAVLEITDLDQEDKLLREKYFGPGLTERKAWMRSALILARGFPFTTTVYVSSFSVDIRLPNQDLFVSSGEDSGVWCTLTTSRKWRNSIKILFVSFHAKVTASIQDRTEPSEIEGGGGKLSSTPLTISNQSLPDQQLPCIFLRWNLGLPRKLFLIELSRDLQWTAEGEPGGVGSSCSVSPPGRQISNIQIWGKFYIKYDQNTSSLAESVRWSLDDTHPGVACRVSAPWARQRASLAARARATATRAAPGSSARSRWAAAAGCWNTKNHVIRGNSIFCVSIRLKYSQGSDSAPGLYNFSWQYFTILN